MLKRIKNLSKGFTTITGGYVEKGQITRVEPWEVKLIQKHLGIEIEVLEEEKPKKKVKK